MPALRGVLETVLYVDEIDRAADFYGGVFQLPELYGDARMRAYDVGGRGVLLLFKRGATLKPVETPGGVIPAHDGSGPAHVAFSIAAEEYEAWEKRLIEKNIAIESRVNWPRGGRSLYFRDPDDHVLELATPGLWRGY